MSEQEDNDALKQCSSTVDSLLREIDQEIPSVANRQLPLQEIGDETMDQIVTYNTMNNAKMNASEQELDDIQPLVQNQSRKSVMFSEEFKFHEYPPGQEQDSVRKTLAGHTEFSWPATSMPRGKNLDTKPELKLEFDSDSEAEAPSESLELSKTDLKDNTVTKLDEKLEHMLGKHESSSNVPRLKEMVDNIDEMVFSSEQEEIKPLSITIQSTSPLNSNDSSAQLLQYDVDDQTQEDDIIERVRHSPSKIPTTNTISINRFNKSEEYPTSSRISSGSSMDESVTTLETTTMQDKFNLLTMTPLADHALPKIEDCQVSNKSLTMLHDNNSRAFSVATTADEYLSAKEFESGRASTEDLQDEESIEELGISAGPARDEETLTNLNELLHDKDVSNESHISTTCSDNGFGPIIFQSLELPKFPPLDASFVDYAIRKSSSNGTVNAKSLEDLNGSEEKASTEASTQEFNFGSLKNVTVGSMSPKVEVVEDKSQSLGSDRSSSNMASLIEEPELNTNEATDTEVNHSSDNETEIENAVACVTSESNVHTQQDLELPNADTRDFDTESIQLNSGEAGNSDPGNHSKSSSEHSMVAPRLPSIMKFSSLFDDDYPFEGEGDTSYDSIDITKSLKTSDYLSIWHTQENTIKTSPALSTNSQFSEQSTGTSNSTVSASSKFKLKPRVISRSKVYYPNHTSDGHSNDEYALSQISKSSILDPLRRNTLLSRRIQQKIKQQKELSPYYGPSIVDFVDEKTKSTTPEPEKLSEIDTISNHSTETVQINPIKDETKHPKDEEISPEDSMTSNLETSNVFSDLIGALIDDKSSFNKSHVGSKEISSAVYQIWDQNIFQNGLDFNLNDGIIVEEKDNKMRGDVLNKLLEEETQEQLPVNENLHTAGLGIIKNTESEIAVCSTCDINGIDVLQSTSMESIFQNSPSDDDPETPSPAKVSHIESPFKVTRARKLADVQIEESLAGESSLIEQIDLKSIDGICSPEDVKVKELSVLPFLNIDSTEKVPLLDNGKLYVLLKGIEKLKLDHIKRHKAEFAIEFDNGTNIIQTPWEPFEETSISLNNEFEVFFSSTEIASIDKIVITMKCKYQNPQAELVEVNERVPQKKKFPFSKTKFKTEKRFVLKSADFDDWDYKFAQDGSFARCTVAIDQILLTNSKYKRRLLHFNLINEWERVYDKKDRTKDIYKLARKPPFTVGELNIEMCFLPRTSNLEKFPKTMDLAEKIVNKYSEQQSIKHEGYLWQEGGDVDGMLQRRYFKLSGNQLVAYHEITRKPKALINLLNVVDVVGDGEISKDITSKVRNFTDIVLFSDYFKLIFENGEVINLNAETVDSRIEWTTLLSRAVALNKFHQPWVKKFLARRSSVAYT